MYTYYNVGFYEIGEEEEEEENNCILRSEFIGLLRKNGKVSSLLNHFKWWLCVFFPLKVMKLIFLDIYVGRHNSISIYSCVAGNKTIQAEIDTQMSLNRQRCILVQKNGCVFAFYNLCYVFAEQLSLNLCVNLCMDCFIPSRFVSCHIWLLILLLSLLFFFWFSCTSNNFIPM